MAVQHSGDPTSGRRPIPLLIAGASVRAAVHSARRSGHDHLLAADLFNDQDLSQACQAWRLDSRYASLPELAARMKPDYWLYTGALENYPSIVSDVSRHVRLLGNDAETLRRIRQPSNLAHGLTAHGLPFPNLAMTRCPRDGHWLRKRRRSAAGLGIRPATAGELILGGDDYFQRHVHGESCSAVFVSCRQTARLLGVTQQLIGDAHFGATGFQYCGSIGPLLLDAQLQRQWQRVGDCLATTFELSGLFGVDAIIRDGQVVPVEVNPRYTASVEVLEAVDNESAIDLHVAACRDERLAGELCQPRSSYFGKAIVFAPTLSIVTGDLIERITALNRQADGPYVADIPHAESSIHKGHPIVTVFAREKTVAGVAQQLRQRAADIVTRLRA